MKKRLSFLKDGTQDLLLRRVIRNTGYLFSSSSITMGLTSIQGILAALLLGPENYGVLGLIILFASSVNRLFSFRMGELVIKFAGQSLAVGNKKQAAAIIKVAGLSETLTSIFAYGVLLLLAPWAAQTIIKDPAVEQWIVIYGLALLANFVTETSTAVLQLGNHYRSQAILNLIQSVITASWIVVLYFMQGSVYDVLNAYLVGKLVFGIGIMAVALSKISELVGKQWWRESLANINDKIGLLKFALSTNLSGTVNLIVRDSEVLWVGYFLTSLQAGYYKFALAIMNVILLPITPFISTTFPEINTTIAKKNWKTLKSLLSKTTLISAIWTVVCIIGVAFFGPWLLGLLKDGMYLPAMPVILILVAGYGFANVFFWNRSLLLAFGKPNFPLVVTFLVGLVKTGLMFLLVPKNGFLMQSGLLSGYFILSVGIIVWRGLQELKKQEILAVE